MADDARNLVATAQAIKAEIEGLVGPPETGLRADGNAIVPPALFRKTRGYLERVANQANGAYSKGWFDASAVMVRRLLETLIIEAFEHHNIADHIKNPSGDFFFLRDLIERLLKEPAWNLSRNAKQALPRLKDVGDKSAHSRRFNAVRSDLEGLKGDLRLAVEELLVLAALR